MAELIVIEYDDMHHAEEVRLKLQKLHRDDIRAFAGANGSDLIKGCVGDFC